MDVIEGGGRTEMESLDRIRCHPLFQECCRKLEEAEKNRAFCRHGLEHLLDVARIAYILNLEKGLALKKEVIYGAALLHDIGKFRQYEDGTPHELAGRELAEKLLSDISIFSEKEENMILEAILEHRRQTEHMSPLGRILYQADKLSRACYGCKAEGRCNWNQEKMNMRIRY